MGGLFLHTKYELINSVSDTTFIIGFANVICDSFDVVFGVCHLFIDDRIMVSEGKAKRTIIQRVIHALRDYKSEMKKITWTSKNPAVAAVNNGLVTAVGNGDTEIVAEYKGQTVSCIVRVRGF